MAVGTPAILTSVTLGGIQCQITKYNAFSMALVRDLGILVLMETTQIEASVHKTSCTSWCPLDLHREERNGGMYFPPVTAHLSMAAVSPPPTFPTAMGHPIHWL